MSKLNPSEEQQVLACLSEVSGPDEKGNYKALCPNHTDINPSLSVNFERGLFNCFGCGWNGTIRRLAEKLGVINGAPQRKPDQRKALGKIVATYNYVDENERLLYQVVRYDPKDFRQRRPDDQGRWTWSLGNVRRVLYHLPKLIQNADRPDVVLFVEGEKDVEICEKHGFVATTNAGGIKEWREEYAEALRGDDVAILADYDQEGEDGARRRAQSISRTASSVKIVKLWEHEPNLPKKGDVSDWFKMGHTADELRHIIDHTPAWHPDPVTAFTGNPKLNTFPMTDAGNAEAFVELFGDKVRYDHPSRRWLLWDTHRWAPDQDKTVVQLALRTARKRSEAAAGEEDGDRRGKLLKWAFASESRYKLDAQLGLAKTFRPVADAGENWNPDPWLFGVANGVVDLQTGDLRQGRPEDRITRWSRIMYDPEAKCPRWSQFLYEVFESHGEGAATMVDWIQRAVGYCLTGDTREQVIFLLYGTGTNGKTTFVERLRHLLGDYHVKADAGTLMTGRERAIRNDIARLAGARLVTAIEPSQTHQLAENIIKEMTGGDRMTARFLHQEFFEFTPQFKIILATNHKPIIKGTDTAIWRRVRLVPFTVSFEGRKDQALAEKLDKELPGILTWAVEGVQKWLEHGLDMPDPVRCATEEYRSESDILRQFLKEATTTHREAKIQASKLYEAYRDWCWENGHEPVNHTQFGRDMATHGYEKKKQPSGLFYQRIGLLEKDDG